MRSNAMTKSLGGHSTTWERGACIGSGCFATVSLATAKPDARVFAVKSVEPAACLPAQLNALENEIRVLRSLPSSPYVVRYLGDDALPSTRNLHLEYLPGGTVADGAAVRDELTVRSLTRCLVSALAHVHSSGVVHCDVKGKNVLVGGEPGLAKLADFGSAFVVSERVPGAIVPRGSPLWMAPEVVRGEYQGPESDVWSLGCTVIEMVAGKPAWEDGGIATLKRISFSDEVPELPAGLSDSGRDFLEKCLRRDPARRWSCDRLLQHPFMAAAPAAEPSPRGVLDWADFNLDDEDDRSDNEYEGASEFHETSAKQRIGKLASGGGANWELSNGWTVVRSNSDEEGVELGDEESSGTSSQYSECCEVELEYSKCGVVCCRYGLRKPEFSANRPRIMSCYYYSLCIGVSFYYYYYYYSLLLLSMKLYNKIVFYTMLYLQWPSK